MTELAPEFVERYATADDAQQLAMSKRMTFGQKFLMGGALYDRECEITKKLIRSYFPEANDQTVLALMRRILDWYHDCD